MRSLKNSSPSACRRNRYISSATIKSGRGSRRQRLRGRVLAFGLLFASLSPGYGRWEKYDVAPAFPKLTFNLPVFVTSPLDGSNRLFVVEQDGRVVWFPNDSTAEKYHVS